MNYYDIEDSFIQEMELTVDEILGDAAPEIQKEEIVNSLLIIFRQRSKEILNFNRNRNGFNETRTNFNNFPQFNLIIPNSQYNAPFPQNYGYIQNNLAQAMPQNQSYFPYQNQIFPPNLQQNPSNFPFFNQPSSIPMSSQTSLPQKQKSEKDDKKKKHSSSKSKSSKSSKTKKFDKDELKNFKIIKLKLKQNPTKTAGDLNGFFKYLTNETHGNIHANGTIEVTSNSINTASSTNHPKSLLMDSVSDGYLSSCTSREIWIDFDFKNMRVEVSNYTIIIKSNPFNKIENWRIEISDDKSNWTVIDNHSSDSALIGANIVRTFSVTNSRFARYIRFYTRQNVPGRDYVISMSSMEFYGRLKIPK